MLRAAAEADVRGRPLGASAGSASAGTQGACDDPLDAKKSCGSHGRSRRNDDRRSTAEIYAKQCLACRIFGSMAIRGRAAVRDLFPWDPDTADEEHMATGGNRQRANQLEQRHGVAIDRVLGSVRHGPFDQDLVPAGVSFWGEISLQNYQVWQLGLLAQAFDAVNIGVAQLGSSKSRGLGNAHIAVVALMHEQIATSAEQPQGVGMLVADDEATAYGLLAETPLPEATPERRGLAVRFAVTGDAVESWLEASRTAVGGLFP